MAKAPTKADSTMNPPKEESVIQSSNSPQFGSLSVVLCVAIVAYLASFASDLWEKQSSPVPSPPVQRKMEDSDSCFAKYFANRSLDPIQLYRNGETTPCGTSIDILGAIQQALASSPHCPNLNSKYPFESLMTQALALSASTCHSLEKDRSKRLGFYGYCDMGPSKTPILFDHNDMIRNGEYLPCHFHTYLGVRITSIDQLIQTDEIFAVPAGRMFIFAPRRVGEIISLPHVEGGLPDQPVYMKVLSLSPRVFDLVNFFSREESADLVERALQETKESHRIKRSSTGASGYNLNKYRTSESGFDTSGATAMKLKRRCFDVLGFDKYIESFSDGLQILRYNLTTAYNKHMDWIQGNDQLEHDYESSGKGGNRFATILLYMTDLGENHGGETVFTEGWPPGQAEEDRMDIQTAITALRESGDGKVLTEGSWEERMVAQCRSRLAIKPNSARAVLFYSQLPNGEEDRSSLHGGCPVLEGTKYAANLWVWNTPRPGFAGNPRNPKVTNQLKDPGVQASFTNTGKNPSYATAELYYEDQFWAKFGPQDPVIKVNTGRGHLWRVVVDGDEVQRWIVDRDQGTEAYSI